MVKTFQGISIVDPDFRKEGNQICCISVYPAEIQFAIFQTEQKRFQVLKSFNLTGQTGNSYDTNVVKDIFEEDEILSQIKSTAFVCVGNNPVSISPAGWEIKRNGSGFSSIHPVDKFKTIENSIQKHTMQFQIENSTDLFLQSQFGKVKYFSLSEILYHRLAMKSEPVFHIHIQQHIITCLALKNSKLIFCNSFLYRTSEDALYFILSSIKLVEFDPEKQDVHVEGEILPDSKIFQLLTKYVRFASFVTREESIQLGAAFGKIQHWFYLPLFYLPDADHQR